VNLQCSMADGKSPAPENLSQASGISRDPQPRDGLCLLAQWDSVWASYRLGAVPYRTVTTWCSGLTEAEGEVLWALLQERAARDWAPTA
jgi:hypothetical protein